MSKALGGIGFSVLLIYFWGSFLIAAPYYNWQYAKTHGFMDWLLFGEVVSTIKAFGWPYHLYIARQQEEAHFLANTPELTEENLPKIKAMMIDALTKQCIGEFDAGADWTRRLQVSGKTFCPCFAERNLRDVDMAKLQSMIGPVGKEPPEADRWKATAIARICAKGE